MASSSRRKEWIAQAWADMDREAWERACAPGDDLTDAGPAAHWRPRTRENAELAYGRYLTYLKSTGMLTAALRVSDRLDRKAFRDFAHELQLTLAPLTVISELRRVVQATQAMDPLADVRAVKRDIRRMQTRAHCVREIEPRLISPVELVRIGREIMAEAERMPKQGTRAAELFRDGAVVLAGTMCPLRLANWQMVVIGKHLLLDEGVLRFDADEMKGKRRYEIELPREVLDALVVWVERYRPKLLRPGQKDGGDLWMARGGVPLSRTTLGRKVKYHLKLRTGKAFSFHMFRHTCASFIADVAPESVLVATGVLDHRRFKTTARHYIRGKRRSAFVKYQDAVGELMRQQQQKKKRRG